MLASPDGRLVVSSLGWVDRSALWMYDAPSDQASLVPVGDAKYLSIFPCKDPDKFVILHHYDGASIRISVHSFDDPAIALGAVERVSDRSSAHGDMAAFEGAPHHYVAYVDPGHAGNYYLLSIDSANQEIRLTQFDWFDSSYDKAYQGIVGVLELPSGNLLVSIQRDSHPVVCDPASGQLLHKISLANRAGNPALRLAPRRREVWADDYDTLLKLDIDSLAIQASRRLQPAANGTGQFIGRWTFDQDESLCLVPRPYSGDVVAISMQTMRTEYVVGLGRRPLEAALLRGGQVISRDWMSGQLLKGTLRKARFFE